MEGVVMFKKEFQKKRVLITGNTGFKGSWLTLWLSSLGAEVIGYSNDVPTSPSLFVDASIEDKIKQVWGDVRDYNKLFQAIEENKPDYIFHLAAQAIVSTSYEQPLETIETNVIGTANILEAIKNYSGECVSVVITSDKCYENVEWLWGYKETDRVGGKDIYSGSKGAAELIFHSYYESFFKSIKISKPIATGRAGNVIGGGDWAKDRIIVDCIKEWTSGNTVNIRSPDATRPWQHVLEPLSGYLTLAVALSNNRELSGESFNFGPLPEKSKTVIDVINDLSTHLQEYNVSEYYKITERKPFHEAGLLRLNCEKSNHILSWDSTLNYSECIEFVGKWYSNYKTLEENVHDFTILQIEKYCEIAKEREKVWSK